MLYYLGRLFGCAHLSCNHQQQPAPTLSKLFLFKKKTKTSFLFKIFRGAASSSRMFFSWVEGKQQPRWLYRWTYRSLGTTTTPGARLTSSRFFSHPVNFLGFFLWWKDGDHSHRPLLYFWDFYLQLLLLLLLSVIIKKKRRNARAAEDFFFSSASSLLFSRWSSTLPLQTWDLITNLWLEKKKVVFGSRHSAFLTELLIHETVWITSSSRGCHVVGHLARPKLSNAVTWLVHE